MADIWVPLRAGSDILFLGALIHYVLENEQRFPRVRGATTRTRPLSLREDFQDTEDLDGLFSGWDAEEKKYDPKSWLYEGYEQKERAGSWTRRTRRRSRERSWRRSGA